LLEFQTFCHAFAKLGNSFAKMRALDPITMIPYMGPISLLTKNRVYWEQYLIRNGFKIMKSNIRGCVVEFIAKKYEPRIVSLTLTFAKSHN
jgi:hypothetical protein